MYVLLLYMNSLLEQIHVDVCNIEDMYIVCYKKN
jgi:hypothetical protein